MSSSIDSGACLEHKKISTILFDLGGVLIELDGPPPLREEWLGVSQPIPHEEKWVRWGKSRYVQQFETGKIPADEFIHGVVKEFGLLVDIEHFREVFIQWPKGFLVGAQALLHELKNTHTLAFFSNTSELHLPRLLNDLKLADYFNHTFASFEVGYFKPDISGYHHVANHMNVPVDEILFVDDNMMNVEGARKAGLHAEKAVGVEQTRQVLKAYGCL